MKAGWLVVAALLLGGCARTPTARADRAGVVRAVACGTADGPGGIPRAHTVFADGRVVRWEGRPGSGQAAVGHASAAALDSLLRAVAPLQHVATAPVMGPLRFVEVETAAGVRRFVRPAGGQRDARFQAAFEACQAAAGAAR